MISLYDMTALDLTLSTLSTFNIEILKFGLLATF